MEALKYIPQQAGLHFDPLVVKTFLELSTNKRNEG
jgi:response regulator RpfG family c-di-GMP phosphodiesterase